ncbi:MAG: baseplate J/gp47 family protein [Peptococcaceae bacterium]|nr:baseplate J/gp47 family protein [Peptococcaceae bacterium]
MSDYNFVNYNSEDIYNTVIGSLIAYCKAPLYPGDERRIFGEGVVSLFASMYAQFDDAARQRMLRYARGAVLDGIGELVGAIRLEPQPAYATFRFSVDAAQTENIIIPQGTRITTDGSIYFATDVLDVLQAGETYVDIAATCTETGSQYNGLSVGTVATLVDMIPYISSVQNITITNGGDDGEAYTTEGDNRFRERIRMAPAQFTTAGPESSYRYFAMSADPDIIDVALDAPEDEPNVVKIYPLMTGGQLPDEDVLKAVADVCSADDVRPMTDKVIALAPETVEYSVNVKYYTLIDEEADAIAAIEGDGGAIDQYNEWQQGALDRDINPDYLRKLMLAPGDGKTGAYRVDIISPTIADVGKAQVARLSGPVTVTHEVL